MEEIAPTINLSLQNERLNINTILQKRKQEKKPLINLNLEEDINIIKKQEQFITNIPVEDFRYISKRI